MKLENVGQSLKSYFNGNAIFRVLLPLDIIFLAVPLLLDLLVLCTVDIGFLSSLTLYLFIIGILLAFANSNYMFLMGAFGVEAIFELVYLIKALCSYHLRDSQYVLVNKEELWAAESHEYLYLWSLDRLEQPDVEGIFQRVLEDGEPRIKPHPQLMYTYLTAVVLYDSADPQALAQLKKLKKRREFKLSLHGWMEFRIAAVDMSTGEITANRSGKILQKDLKRLTARMIQKHLGEEKNQ